MEHAAGIVVCTDPTIVGPRNKDTRAILHDCHHLQIVGCIVLRRTTTIVFLRIEERVSVASTLCPVQRSAFWPHSFFLNLPKPPETEIF